MTETGDQQKPDYIEIEVPEYLAPGQNFYDQPPFTIIGEVAERLNINPLHIKSYLTSEVPGREALLEDINFDWKEFTGEKIKVDSLLKSNISYYITRFYRLKNNPEIVLKFMRAIKEVVEVLKDYPYWPEYVSMELNRDVYHGNGKYIPYKGPQFSTRSYPKWLTDEESRLKNGLRNKTSVLWGIQEVFPQDFAGQSPTHVPTPEGIKPQNKRWKILKASEIVRENR